MRIWEIGFLRIYSCWYRGDMRLELHVNVAERSSLRRHHGTNCCVGTIDAQCDGIREESVSARWAVVQSDGSGNGVLSVLEILVLPNPPSTIDLSVVKPECWVSWRNKDVSTRVTTDGEVTGCMNAVETTRKVTLHDGLEVVDVGVLSDQIGGVLVG